MDSAEQYTLVLEKLDKLEEAMHAMADLLHTVVELLETLPAARHPAPEAPTLKVATYEQMYGPIAPAPEPAWARAPLAPPSGRLRRWFFKE